jgi:hypothetical protein
MIARSAWTVAAMGSGAFLLGASIAMAGPGTALPPAPFTAVPPPLKLGPVFTGVLSTTTTPKTAGGIVAQIGSSTGATIVLTSPAHGSFTTQAATLVQGTVTAPAGVALLTVNGNPVTVGSNGAFSELVALTPGLNVIDVEATDGVGVPNKMAVGLIYGSFQPAGKAIQSGLAVRLNQGSFTAAEKAIASKLSGQMLTNAIMSQNPLASWSSWAGSANIDCTSASFGNPEIVLTPQSGDLQIQVTVPNVNIQLQENGSGIVPSVSGYVTCDAAVLTAQVQITVSNGAVTTSIVNDSVNLQNFNWGINGLPGFITNLFTGDVQGAIQGQVSSVVKSEVPPEVNKMIAGATGDPITQTIMGSKATFSLTPGSISIDQNGLSATVNADCSLAPVAGYTPLSAPGSLVSGGSVPQNGGPGPDIYASVNEDLLNRAGFAVWQSGVSQIQINNSPSSIFQMPAGYPLDMELLSTLIPELTNAASPSDSIALNITPLLPPVFSATGAPNNIEASLGEMQIDIVDTTTNQNLVTIALHVRGGASLSLNAQDTFDVKIPNRPQIDASLVASIVPTVNTLGIDNLMTVFVPTILQVVGNQWSGFPLPTYPGLTPAGATIYQDGPQGTFVTAAANFESNGPSLPKSGPVTTTLSDATPGFGAASSPPKTTTTPTTTSSTVTASSWQLTPTAPATGTGTKTMTTLGGGTAIAPGSQITTQTGYVALVEDGLESAVQPLLAGYQARGVNTALVPLSQVQAAGRDRAEQIRNWLVANLHDGVKRYLLLVGGPTAIPFRTCTPSPAVGNVVSDLYYGDLSGNWDSNGNGIYGEIADQPGFDADCYVGRLPYDDAASVTAAVNAIEASRNNRGAWSNNCLEIGATTIVPGDDPLAADTAKTLYLQPDGWNCTTAFAPESFIKGDMVLTPDTIVDQLQSNPVGLMLTFSHGSQTGLMSHPTSTTWANVLTESQLASFPTATPPVEVACACYTADPTYGLPIGAVAVQQGVVASWLGCTVETDPRSGGGEWMLAMMELSQNVAGGNSLGQSLAVTIRDFVANGLPAVQGCPEAQADLYQQAMSWIIYGDPGLSVGPMAH